MAKRSHWSMEANSMEIENQMETIVIPRARSTSGTNIENSRPVLENIPLLLCDIQQHLNPTESLQPSTFTCNAFSAPISFRTCIVHARIVSRLNANNTFYNYAIDDGTATLQMNLLQRQEVIQKMCHLRGETDALTSYSLARDAGKMASCLRQLLNQTIEQVDTSDLAVGSMVLVYGQPNYDNGRILFNAFNILRCTLTRDLEIAFKDYLIDFYSSKRADLT